MNAIERRRPVTRRRRLAHLGVGGVIAAVAGAHIGADLAAASPRPAPILADPVGGAAAVTDFPPRPLPSPAPVSRSIRTPRPPLPTAAPRRAVPKARTAGRIPAVWLALVRCESGRFGWAYGSPEVGVDPGYDFEGGPNFTNGTWLAYGGGRYARHAYDATPVEQITVAERVLRGQGVRAWPECGPRVGLTGADASLPLG